MSPVTDPRQVIFMRIIQTYVFVLALLFAAAHPATGFAQPGPVPRVSRCVPIELFIRGDGAVSRQAQAFLEKYASGRAGIRLQVHDVIQDDKALRRLHEISTKAGIERAKLPATFIGRQFRTGWEGEELEGERLRRLLTIELFVRRGCPHCGAAEAFFARIGPSYPGYQINTLDVINNAAERARFDELCRRHHVQAASLPGIRIGNKLLIGYQDDAITGKRIESLLKSQTVPCDGGGGGAQSARHLLPVEPGEDLSRIWVLADSAAEADAPEVIPESADIDLEAGDPEWPEEESDVIEVPLLGKLRVRNLGLPAFTFLVGLIDGFNPCAMWVLLFLLSILVNLHDRIKILAIAGTFVLVSGLAYYAFMAAWLNVFMLIGLARPAQITLAVLAIGVGSIHVKDFFAFKRGISLSIPESAKPGIYERVRKIVMAEYLGAAIAGAIVLAVLVNTIELLCTAGLPALYTQVLTMQQLPPWQNYAYLGLYIAAYMLDDILMLSVVVFTLSRRRLQERAGRWLKLVSGVAILVLGIVMLFKPEWLV